MYIRTDFICSFDSVVMQDRFKLFTVNAVCDSVYLLSSYECALDVSGGNCNFLCNVHL
jgi:hypothetical protein